MKTTPPPHALSAGFSPQVGLTSFQLRAFSLVELLAILTVVGILLAVLIPSIAKARAKAARISCIGRLKNIGLSNRIFATDNNDLFPWHADRAPATNRHKFPDLSNLTAGDQLIRIFRSLSNDLNTPIIIAWPADTRKPADRWQELSTSNISYFLGTSSEETYPQSFMAGDRNLVIEGQRASGTVRLTAETKNVEWDGTTHKFQGNAAMGDGSVQQMNTTRLRESLKNTGLTTNILIFP